MRLGMERCAYQAMGESVMGFEDEYSEEGWFEDDTGSCLSSTRPKNDYTARYRSWVGAWEVD